MFIVCRGSDVFLKQRTAAPLLLLLAVPLYVFGPLVMLVSVPCGVSTFGVILISLGASFGGIVIVISVLSFLFAAPFLVPAFLVLFSAVVFGAVLAVPCAVVLLPVATAIWSRTAAAGCTQMLANSISSGSGIIPRIGKVDLVRPVLDGP